MCVGAIWAPAAAAADALTRTLLSAYLLAEFSRMAACCPTMRWHRFVWGASAGACSAHPAGAHSRVGWLLPRRRRCSRTGVQTHRQGSTHEQQHLRRR
jgi:hypothetical protein